MAQRPLLFTIFLTGAALATGFAAAQDTLNFPTIGEVVRLDPRLDAVVPPGTKIEVLATGFDWSEGPVWLPDADGGRLLFSDIPKNAIYEWTPAAGARLFMKPSGYTGVADYGREPGSNGLLLDGAGRLICCEHGDRRISVLTAGGGKRTLVDNYRGRRLNSPNDAVLKSNGDLYFTDPPYGLPQGAEDPRRELDFCGVYRLSAEGVLTLLTDKMTRPNGIGFSPDERTLYVAQSDSAAAVIMAFPVLDDGTIGAGRVFYDATADMGKLPGAPDGLEVAVDGTVFATGPGGVYVFTPAGELLGRISTGERTANVAWGDDGGTLYLTADMYLCRIRTNVRGALPVR